MTAARSCDGCRYRKTKCERTGQGDCVQCAQKGFECTTSHATRKSYKARSGKRIEKFKALQKKTPSATALSVFADPPVLSPTLADSRMACLEESDAFASDLVQMAFSSFSTALSPGKWSQVRREFDLAGRRPSQIQDPITEVLIRCAMAFGSLLTDCPALVGKDAPSLRNFGQLRGQHLDTYGQRRFATATRLYDQAIASVDSRGIFRQNSTDAISILLICFELGTYFDSPMPSTSCSTQRYIDAAVSIMKQSCGPSHALENNPTGVHGNNYCTWAAAALEAVHSGIHGNESSIAERQLPWFFGQLQRLERDIPLNTSRIQHIAASGNRGELVAESAQTWWFKFYRVLRNIGDKVAVPIKWEDRLPDTAVLAAAAQIEAIQQSLDISSDTLRTSPYAANLSGREEVSKDLVAVDLAVSVAVRLLYAQVNKFKEKADQRKFYPLASEQDTLERLRVVEERLAHLLTSTARRIAACIAAQDLVSVVYFSPSASIGSAMPGFWAEILLASCCAAENGLVDWSAEAKCHGIQCLIDALKAQSWIWPARSQEARELEKSLDAFKATLASLSLSSPSTTTFHESPATELVFDPFMFLADSTGFPLSSDSNLFPPPDSAPPDTFDVLDYLDLNVPNFSSQFQPV